MSRLPPVSNATRVLITGGAGFIGSHLAELLVARGAAVTVLDDLSTGSPDNLAALAGHPRLRFVRGSVADPAALDALVAEAEVVFHLAAAVGVALVLRDLAGTLETNIVGTLEVLRAARRHGCRVLLASSSEVYGKSAQIPLREDGDRLLGPTTNVRWGYATSKAADEYLGLAFCRQHGVPVTVARLFNTIGPRQTGRYGMVVPRLVGQALAGEPLTVFGDGRQSRSFCDVLDTVEALAGLAGCPAAVGEVFNVGADREITIRDLALAVLAQAGAGDPAGPPAAERIRLVPYEQAYGPGFEDMRRRVPDLGKIRRVLGWQPRRPFAETLARILARPPALLARSVSDSISPTEGGGR